MKVKLPHILLLAVIVLASCSAQLADEPAYDPAEDPYVNLITLEVVGASQADNGYYQVVTGQEITVTATCNQNALRCRIAVPGLIVDGKLSPWVYHEFPGTSASYTIFVDPSWAGHTLQIRASGDWGNDWWNDIYTDYFNMSVK